MRGGTSKGLFINPKDLPSDPEKRDSILLAAIGSPDPYGKQIDGLGGATSSTSKIVLVEPSDQQGIDVNYTFGHIAIDQPIIDYSGNCGNLSSAVGVFAIEQGMIKSVKDGVTPVHVWQTNLQQHMIIHVPTQNGRVEHNANCLIAGINQAEAPIVVEFLRPGMPDGSVLPTGYPTDQVQLANGKEVEVSLVISGNPTVFVEAHTLDLRGIELPDQINADQNLLDLIEEIRCLCAIHMGLAETFEQAQSQPGTPKLCLVSPPQTYISTAGNQVPEEDIDITARIFSMGKLHHALTGTGAIAIAVAAKIPDSLVNKNVRIIDHNTPSVRIGHSAGTINCEATVSKTATNWFAESANYIRTARTLMKGEVFIPQHYL